MQLPLIRFLVAVCALISSLQAKICLLLLVEDEEEVIEQTLNSVKESVDAICICDWGSHDDTSVLIEAFKRETSLPIKIAFLEKGEAELTQGMRAAQEMLQEMGCLLSESYILFLQPGSVLKQGECLREKKLTAEVYTCKNTKPLLSLCKRTPHLLKASLQWQAENGLFPEWISTTPLQSAVLEEIAVEECTLSESLTQKKIENLLASLKNKEDAQSLLYLAQVHKAQRDFTQAIQLHKAHIDIAKKKEDIWFSHYMIGCCYEAQDQWEEALHWYLQAYQYDPGRAESLQKISSYYRHRGENHLAYLFAHQGARQSLPEEQTLWVVPAFFPYQFEEELSIAAYYTPYKKEGEEAANDLLLRKNVPWHLKDQTYKNMLFYAQKLPCEKRMPITFELPRIHEGTEERYHPMNPSILKTKEGYQVICRSVNYTQKGAKAFGTNDPSGIFRTRNFLLQYDKSFKLQAEREILENLARKRIRSFNLEGLDDCRIFSWDDTLWFSCTTGDTNPLGTFQISLCKLEDKPKEKTIHVERLIPLQGPDPYRCEKNWLPFIKEGNLHLIYSYDPFLVYSPNLQTGACTTQLSYMPSHDFSHFRGSAAPISFDGGYLLLVHEVVLQTDYSRCYLHRFLFLNRDFRVTKISKPFYFDHLGVEYCCSMTLDHSGKKLLAAVGLEDTEACVYFFNSDRIRSLLYPLQEKESHVFSS